MDYTGGSFGYDQINIEPQDYFNKDDSILLARDRARPQNEMKGYLNDMARGKKKHDNAPLRDDDAVAAYYLRRNIKDEIEKYATRMEKYTGKSSDGVPKSSGYPLRDHNPIYEKPAEPATPKKTIITCKACDLGDIDQYQKKYDNLLTIILFVVVVFCAMQYINIQNLHIQLRSLSGVVPVGRSPAPPGDESGNGSRAE